MFGHAFLGRFRDEYGCVGVCRTGTNKVFREYCKYCICKSFKKKNVLKKSLACVNACEIFTVDAKDSIGVLRRV